MHTRYVQHTRAMNNKPSCQTMNDEMCVRLRFSGDYFQFTIEMKHEKTIDQIKTRREK